MKKNLFFVVIAAILAAHAVMPVSAQDEVEFTPLTLPAFFNWGDKAINVYEFLSKVDGLVCEPNTDEDQGKKIDCSAQEFDEEITHYAFYFTDDENLYLVTSAVNYLGDYFTIQELFETFAETFSKIKMRPYTKGFFYDFYAEDTDIIACGIVPGTAYLCLSATEGTEETLPYISVIYSEYSFARDLDAGL